MKLFTSSVLLACLCGPALACGAGGTQMITDGPSSLKIFASLEPITVSKPFAVNLILCNDDGGGAAAATAAAETKAPIVEANGWMPRHKHGMNYAPVVTPKGDGTFTVSNMVFHMPGLWQVRVNVRDRETDKPTTYLLDVVVK